MATIESPGPSGAGARVHDETTVDITSGISMGEAIGGLATLILAIVGLAGVDPRFLGGIAAIVMGSALVCEGAALMARVTRGLQETGVGEGELGGGMTAEFLGGGAGIILGILALINIYPWVLLPVAVLVFGASLLLGAGAMTRLTAFHERVTGAAMEAHRRLLAELAAAARSAQVLVGLAALVLGILAVTGVATQALTLVAFLCLGVAILASGAAVSNRAASLLHPGR